MELWPAIDLRGGNCVRLLQGDYAKETVFGSDPVAMVSRFLAGGARRLHIVDLDGAKAGAAVQADLVRRMAAAAGIPCQVGGGIRTAEAAEAYLDAGLARVILGSVAVEEPALLERLASGHPGRIVLGLDARDGRVASAAGSTRARCSPSTSPGGSAISRWRRSSTPTSPPTARSRGRTWPRSSEMIQSVDGLPVIASGGIATLDDIRRVAASAAEGCIVGRALYDAGCWPPPWPRRESA
jgi:phosphoribosylformimino-5-aminoimidazole carboxamide ribotide isomerase